jgi:hypothetical protein
MDEKIFGKIHSLPEKAVLEASNTFCPLSFDLM